MKKIFASLCMALAAVAMMAQQPIITFEKTEHDFGKINEADGRVSVVFKFKNEGMAPLVLSNVRASCGCTTPTWTKEPVEPGQTGSITVTYNPNGRPGRFQKTVTITSNASEATKKVYIKGEVIPKPAKPENKYTVSAGPLSLKNRILDLGTIKKGEFKQGEIEYANLTQNELKIELATSEADKKFLSSQTTLSLVKQNETGKFVFVIDTKATKIYGPVEVSAYVVVNGKQELTDEYKLTIKAEIEEDFSGLTQEERQQAPIIEVPKTIDMGTVAAGKVMKYMFPVKNIGVNPLEIRRVYTNDNTLSFKSGKAVKSGKKGSITVEINAKDKEPGKYSRQVTILSNDFEHPKQVITLQWTVE